MANAEGALSLESLACIDASSLSQSELHALSLSSLSSFDLRSTHDLVNPKIDPSLFNESAGSRRQTYSRPRRRSRVAGLLPTPKLPLPLPLPSFPQNAENRVIIDYLKQLIREDPKFDQVELAPPPPPPPPCVPEPEPRAEPDLVRFGSGERKRKRGRKPKVKVHLEECYRGMEIVNKNGVPIDVSALANSEDPFAEELRRRTEGLQSEEELLGFLRDLLGQWGSRRKKRRIVDAADFGDVLPLGWKLLLGLKRKDGRAWIYCRRYISPSGQQFVTCKEVSSYLQSLYGHSDAQLQIVPGSENILQEHSLTAENSAGVTHEDQDQWQIVATNSDVPGLSVSNERVREVALLGIDNLADVQIHDLFECHKCSMTFDEKDSYLQHLLSFHQRTTRRYRLGSSVGDGVIIKDGKFECQFCHKVFLERRRYNGHVGIHVRNYVRRVDDSPGQGNVQRTDMSPVREDVPSRISKMDALIEIAQNSIMEDSVMEPHSSAKLNMIPALEIAVGALDQDINFESPVSEDSLTDTDVVQDLNEQDSPYSLVDGKVEENYDDNRIIDARMVTCLDNMVLLSVNEQNVNASETSKGKDDVALTVEAFDQSGINLEVVSQSPLFPLSGNHIMPESEKNEKSGYTNTRQFELHEDNCNKSELKTVLDGCRDVPVSSNVQEIVMSASEENVVHSRVSNPSISTEQSLDCFAAFSSDKGGKQFCSGDHGHDNAKGFRELRLDEIVMEGTYSSSVQFESQEVMLNMDGRNQLTTVCVWCGIEFYHDAVNSEIQSDSVGFMCPACKAKISGQINVLDSGSPNADHL
ncbi:uncharacterized protein LOC133308766 isoform X2 [Gastrolobium bilobum]|uniref:uncharacterized protein LOC133308766 isoform X2 n=1 Tax=Gastrolobium bilobum TaxID=150636 RepID=UPI002AAFC593|nr:uncharacterized protein LOC133308766 isoform X2 [Gastrolobium bilobum]